MMIADIQAAVCRHYKLPREAMRCVERPREIARPRQVAMYLARRLTDRSYPMIGRHFGGRVHHTVMHAERRIETLRATDPRIEADVLAITAKLSQPQPQGLRHSEGAM